MLSEHLRQAILAFRRERDWEQFHTPQNLAVAVSVEAGELLEHFQWSTPSQQRPRAEDRTAIALEMADIAILMTYLANDLEIDIESAVTEKLAINATRYPVEKAKGSAAKYDKL